MFMNYSRFVAYLRCIMHNRAVVVWNAQTDCTIHNVELCDVIRCDVVPQDLNEVVPIGTHLLVEHSEHVSNFVNRGAKLQTNTIEFL
jgi:hypothetical protein